MSGFKRFVLVVFLLVLASSIGARTFLGDRRSGANPPDGATGFLAPQGGGAPEEPTTLERYLPYLSEGAFFAIIGFALGYTSRKVVKVGLVLLALCFLAIQALVWTGHAQVDWVGVLAKVNEHVFNLKDGETITQFLTRRVPSAGSLVAGYVLGFRRG
jgi:uncharacterized membrane protein (Fun14 family)